MPRACRRRTRGVKRPLRRGGMIHHRPAAVAMVMRESYPDVRLWDSGNGCGYVRRGSPIVDEQEPFWLEFELATEQRRLYPRMSGRTCPIACRSFFRANRERAKSRQSGPVTILTPQPRMTGLDLGVRGVELLLQQRHDRLGMQVDLNERWSSQAFRPMRAYAHTQASPSESRSLRTARQHRDGLRPRLIAATTKSRKS